MPLVAGVVVIGLGLAALGCGSTPTMSCTGIEFLGNGSPDAIVVSDLPLRGADRAEALQINDAVRAELKARGYAAGNHTIGFQACDDSTAAAGRSDPRTCAANANAYADNDQVIGVIGTLDSRCATIVVPTLNAARNGGIPIVSPTNTYPCLTRGGAGCELSEPGRYYPTGKRNYVRVVANDTAQGAAAAEFALAAGVRKVYVLHDGEAYGVGIATGFRRAAESLGIDVVGFAGWDPAARSYASLFRRIGAANADAVFLGGVVGRNGGRLIRDKVAVLGRNEGAVKLIASDGFRGRTTVEEAGAAAAGMYVADFGIPYAELPDEAKARAEAVAAGRPGAGRPSVSAIHGAQAAAVLLDAIAGSDGSRSDVTARLLATRVADGPLGSFRFDANGDPTDASGPIAGFTIFEIARGLKAETTVYPRRSAVRAAARE